MSSVLGLDKLLEYASNEWVQDIKSYQLPLILKGVGPMHHVTQLGTLPVIRYIIILLSGEWLAQALVIDQHSGPSLFNTLSL